jgi:serine/threonine-protein kinase
MFSTRVLFPAPPPPGDLREVPDLTGMEPDGAGIMLRTAGLTPGRVDSVRHPTVSEGLVLGQSPLPGQLAQAGDSVRVTVSLGPEVRPVPDVLRLRGERALMVLEATGFSVAVDSAEGDAPAGTVVGIEPPPETEIALPAEILLTVSLGPPRVEMPLLLGLMEEEALALLDSLGLVVSEVETRFRFGMDQGRVVEQQPEAETIVEQGSAVRLVVGRRGREERNNRREEP